MRWNLENREPRALSISSQQLIKELNRFDVLPSFMKENEKVLCACMKEEADLMITRILSFYYSTTVRQI